MDQVLLFQRSVQRYQPSPSSASPAVPVKRGREQPEERGAGEKREAKVPRGRYALRKRPLSEGSNGSVTQAPGLRQTEPQRSSKKAKKVKE